MPGLVNWGDFWDLNERLWFFDNISNNLKNVCDSFAHKPWFRKEMVIIDHVHGVIFERFRIPQKVDFAPYLHGKRWTCSKSSQMFCFCFWFFFSWYRLVQAVVFLSWNLCEDTSVILTLFLRACVLKREQKTQIIILINVACITKAGNGHATKWCDFSVLETKFQIDFLKQTSGGRTMTKRHKISNRCSMIKTFTFEGFHMHRKVEEWHRFKDTWSFFGWIVSPKPQPNQNVRLQIFNTSPLP